jgi:hypothetical protein
MVFVKICDGLYCNPNIELRCEIGKYNHFSIYVVVNGKEKEVFCRYMFSGDCDVHEKIKLYFHEFKIKFLCYYYKNLNKDKVDLDEYLMCLLKEFNKKFVDFLDEYTNGIYSMYYNSERYEKEIFEMLDEELEKSIGVC